MASYSNILAYEIPLTEEPGMLQVHEVARVGHNLTATPQLPPSFPIPFFKFPHFASEIQVRRDEPDKFTQNIISLGQHFLIFRPPSSPLSNSTFNCRFAPT